MKVTECIFPYDWRLSDGYPAKGIEPNGLKVFGTFICGGGSSMGYKLAGYHHLGGVELDPKIAAIYKANHNPEMLFVEDIRDFLRRDDLPSELFSLDILDGSPPCSTFSMAGKREKAWGKAKQFAEGQKLQRLDDLPFVYCDLIKRLQPRTFILENVSGLVKGNAKAYMANILSKVREAGYIPQVFLLNGAKMGVPQTRERVFVIGQRKDQGFPPLHLDFGCRPIPFGEVMDKDDTQPKLTPHDLELWRHRRKGDKNLNDINQRVSGTLSGFTDKILYSERVANTLIHSSFYILFDVPRTLNEKEIKRISTFPLDYDTKGKATFLCGMSVPPVMTAQIARQMFLQWFNKSK